MLRVIVLSVLLCITSFGNLACTYNGALRDDFHQPSGDLGSKLPLKVALVADPTIKAYEFRSQGAWGHHNVAVYPSIIKATAAELAGVRASQSCGSDRSAHG